MITKLILADGTVISSGTAGENAVMSMGLTQSVNAGTELTVGSCCAAMAELTVLTKELSVRAGTELTVYRDDVLVGRFIAQRPTRTGRLLRLTAYDRVSLLDQDLTDWLSGLTGWPYSLYKLAAMVCAQCGLELANETIPNGDYSVEKFTAVATGRQLMQWIGQAAGCYCTADPTGRLVLGWYTPKALSVTAGGANYYYADSLQMQDYQVAPIEKVRLCQLSTDVGVVWPNAAGKRNTYTVQGNPLLAVSVTGKAETVAKSLYERLSAVTYTPCQVTVPEDSGITAGDIITIDGRTVYVMTARTHNGRRTLECTGSPSRDAVTAVNQVSYKALSGRVLELTARVEGLTVENRDSAGDLAKLALSVEGLSAAVSTGSSTVEQRLTKLEQTAQELSVKVQKGIGQVVTSTGYTFGADGLRIAQSGTEMENRLDHTGMFVSRAGQVILRGNDQGVLCADLQVENYLNVGRHARFEDYAGRTACFYIEGGA